MWPTEQNLESGKGNGHTGVTQPSAAPIPVSSAPSTQTVSACVLLLRDKPQPAAGHSSPPWSAERKSETGKGDHCAGDRQEPYWHRRCQRPARARPPSARRPPTAPAEHGTPRRPAELKSQTGNMNGRAFFDRHRRRQRQARQRPPSTTTPVCQRTAPTADNRPRSEPRIRCPPGDNSKLATAGSASATAGWSSARGPRVRTGHRSGAAAGRVVALDGPLPQ